MRSFSTANNDLLHRLADAASMSVLVLPWLNPFAAGPSPAVIPWLCSAACITLWFLLKPFGTDLTTHLAGRAWLVAALISAFFGVWQYLGLATLFGQWINQTLPGEAFGNLRQRNQFATLTNVGLAALLWRKRSGKRHLFWEIPAAVLLAAGNAASSSRTGIAQLAMLVAAMGIWRGKPARPTRTLLLFAVLSYFVAAFTLPLLIGSNSSETGILARFNDRTASCESRLILWSNVLHLIAEKPWLGWGWGELDYAHFITLYPSARFCDILDNAHNLPLHLAVELGVPVAVFASGLGAWLVWRGMPWRETDPTRQMAWAILALIMLHSMLEYPLWYGPFQIAAGLCIWLLCSTRHKPEAAATENNNSGNTGDALPISQSSMVKIGTATLTVLLLAGVAYASWDYHRISQIYLPPSERSPVYRENTMEKIRGSWLFRNQVLFAELTTTEITPENAAHVNALAHEMLHFSPEARVAEKLIESAVMLGRDDEALFYLARYRAAFPSEHAAWAKARGLP